MRKVLILMLVFAAIGFAAQANVEGDVLLTPPLKVDARAAVAAGIEGFDIGTKGSTEAIRDLWTGSDFDDDGNKEVMFASYDGGGSAYVYEIDGDNSATLFFDTGDMGGSGGTAVRHVTYGDLDGNGMQELLVSVNSSDAAIGGVWAFEYDTVGDSMRAPVQMFGDIAGANRWYCESITVGDVDKDGVEEIFFGNNGSLNAYDIQYIASVDSGSFAEGFVRTKIEFTHSKSSSTFPLGGSPYGGVMADLNGDGMNEVIFSAWDHGAMLIVENDSADNYTAVNYIQTDLDRVDDLAYTDFVINDLDGDGRDEVYASLYSGGRLYVTTCPEGTELADMDTSNVSTIDDFGSAGNWCTTMGDLDGNGLMNIYASGGGSYLTNHEFFGDDPTDSTHWVKLDNIVGPSFSGVYGVRYAGDLDGDGYNEIYGANTGSSTVMASAIEDIPTDVPAVFFSEYCEGSGNNKFIEVYNGTDATINLDDYRIAQAVNGGGWAYYHTFPAGATLEAGDVWVMLANTADSALVDYLEADEVLAYPSVVHHNGDDARAIEYTPDAGTTWYKTDQIGYPNFDPGSGWDVAGVATATANHTLIRKRSVTEGNLNWNDAAGTTTANSEWEVFAINTMKYMGEHPSNDYMDDFADGNHVYKWYSANSGYTSRIWEDGDTCLTLSDGGWTIDARVPVYATPGTFFEASVVVKTVGFTGDDRMFLDFGVDGLMANAVKVSVDSTDTYTEFSVMGYAEEAEGSMYFFGQSRGGAAYVYIDEISFTDDSKPGMVLSSVADARMIADGDPVATKGVVTVSTQYGYAGPVYIQDETAGIAVYGASVAQNVADGDEVIVVGEIDIYNGLVEVSGTPEVVVVSTGNVVEPIEVTWDDIKDAESYEGQLVVMRGCDTLDAGLNWEADGAGENDGVYLKDRNDSTFYCYIDKDTDIDGSPAPDIWPINITGIVGDYRGAQLLPRSLADFNPNVPPQDFMILNPVDGDSIKSLDDPALVDMPMGEGGDSVKCLFINWTTAVDTIPPGDSVTYTMKFIGDGPEEEMATKDTFMYVPINEDEPYGMNGTFTYYFEATDLAGESSISDTQTITFDFPAPPELMYADLTLLDGVPTWYAQFNLPLDAPEVADFSVLDVEAPAVVTPTAVTVVAPNAVMVAAPMDEDGHYALVASGLTAPGATISVTDTSRVLKAYIPFSDKHPEDKEKQIESFNTDTGVFWDPNGSGSTRGITQASDFVVQDSVVYNGTGAAALNLYDDPAVEGGWYVRLYHTLSHTIQLNSEILLMVKGVGDVDLRISIKDGDGSGGYEQGPWKHVTLCEEDWQVVSFDIPNDEVEGWVNGDGTIDGTTGLIEAIHLRSTSDEDVTLYLDGFTERIVLTPVNITLNVIMKKQVADEAFNLATDFVDVAGTFNDWGGTSMVMDDFDGDTTYSIVVPLLPYSTHNFKFRINGDWNDETAEFPYGGPAREVKVRDYDRAYTYWYDDDTLHHEDAIDGIPVEFALHQNYPNPFNPTTTINFDLPEVSDVKLVIYDITGRKVRTLVNESSVNAGYLKINWNGRDDYGNGVSTGMYIYRLQAGDFVDVKKMTFLK